MLILDEPINGLDPEGVAEFRQILRTLNQERETTILISSHILPVEEVRFQIRALLLHGQQGHPVLGQGVRCPLGVFRYGFMEQGRLLEEISAETLHDKCRTCLRLEVDDADIGIGPVKQLVDLRADVVKHGGHLRSG